MKLPRDTFDTILSTRGMELTILASRSGVSIETLEGIRRGTGDLKDAEIEAIASELAVPVRALFASKVEYSQIIDFRSAQPGTAKLQKGTLQALAFVERISGVLSSIGNVPELSPDIAKVTTNHSATEEAINLAKKWREKWGISNNDQLDWQDANRMYVSFREFIESLGISVIHRSFDSDEVAGMYLHVNNGPHTIVINTTKSSKARKLFTLGHEFCHVLLRAEGASNPSVLNNNLEKFCNKFSAYLLAPDSVITEGLDRFHYTPSLDDNFIRLFAKKLGISQEATVRRLVELNFLSNSDYSRWRSQFNGPIPTGDQGEPQSGGNSDPLVTKRTTYGTLLLSLLKDAKAAGQLDEIDIYRLSGLKPKYQNQLFGAA